MSAKRLIQTSLKSVASLLAPGASRSGVRVLEYHYIDRTGSSLSITPELFREHLIAIRGAGYRSLTSDEFIDRTLNREAASGEREVFITFDDGFDNFHAHAAPLLHEFGMPATVFVVTDLIGGPPIWLQRDGAAIDRFRATLNVPQAEREVYDRALATFLASKLMTWEQIADVRKLGIDVHSHTASHPFLAALADRPEALRDELQRPRQAIRDRLGTEAELICYPYGDCNDAVIAAARDVGYRVGFLSGRLNPQPDAMRVGRVPIGGDMPAKEVAFRLGRAHEVYRRMVSR